MKNNILYILLTLISFNCSSANSFEFETKKIEIIDNKKIIIAETGTATSTDGNLTINADKFIYKYEEKILNAYGNGSIIIKSKNIEVFFNELTANQNNSIIKLNGDIEFIDKNKSFKVLTDRLVINQNKNYVESKTKSLIIDKFKNNFVIDKFYFNLDGNLLKVENLIYTDVNKNLLNTSLAYIDIKNEKLFSKDIELNLASSDENEPRIKGNSAIIYGDITEIKKGVFTNCKKRDGCAPWKITSDSITHDKKKKQISYNNAKLFIMDVPILYFPRFFHPDPTVKRQTGFLAPSFNNSVNSSKNFVNLPFFYVINENKDITFSPKLYSDQDLLLRTEYRQANKNSLQTADFSFLKKDNDGHFFYEFDKSENSKKFKRKDLKIKFQQVSNKRYFKKNKLNSELTADTNVLENSIGLILNADNYFFDLDTTIFENLDKSKNDRYEFIFPKIDFTLNVDNKTKLDGDFIFESNNLARNYDTNVFEKSIINNLSFYSYPIIKNNGLNNSYEFTIKNSNTDSKNSSNFKNKESMSVSGLFQFNSTLPLIKYNKDYQNILIPKMSLKIAPNHTKDIKNDENKININNVYSLNRINKTDTIEGGLSLTYGANYSIKRNIDSQEILSFKLANNLRLKENEDLPHLNQMNQKTSNFFTELYLKPANFLNIKYNSAIKNNFSEISNENILAEFEFKSFKMSFDYLNDNNTINKNSYLANTTSYDLDNSNSFIFKTREDKNSNFNEFYKLIYQYKNDCLAASIEYNKDYYNDKDFKSEETVFFKLVIIPFSETSSPNLLN